MSSGFLERGTTYLPSGFSARALARFGRGELEPLLAELRALGRPYERAGIDRALAIAADLALLGAPRETRILDVGCSVGTLALLLSEVGYPVTGIDSDVVARVQEWQDDSILASARAASERPRCRLLRADLRDHLKDPESQYDVALLLGVLHHWLAGYGYSGEERMDREDIRRTLQRLCERVRSCLYVEVPIVDEWPEMPPDPEGEFLFPGWFLEAGLARDVRMIASTIATNGKPRRLYRVDLA